jgi:ATP-binding cassette subfamily B protein
VFEVLDLKPAIAEIPGARDVTGSASVEFEHVDFTYPDAAKISLPSLEPAVGVAEAANQQVLVDVSFSVAPGQTVALVGPSGSGKTTITHLVARLYDATGGSVRVAGDDVRDLRLESLRSTVGYVTQDAHLFHDTIGANLRYAKPDATDDEIWHALTDAQVADLVRRLPDGLDTVVGERGYRLSGGERQRFAIARLLLKAPSIVVLDEATAHLDTESEVAVQRALDETMKGRTAIVVAHRLSTIRAADQILVVSAGRIVQRGTHDELLAAGGLYSELHRAQFSRSAREVDAVMDGSLDG